MFTSFRDDYNLITNVSLGNNLKQNWHFNTDLFHSFIIFININYKVISYFNWEIKPNEVVNIKRKQFKIGEALSKHIYYE